MTEADRAAVVAALLHHANDQRELSKLSGDGITDRIRDIVRAPSQA